MWRHHHYDSLLLTIFSFTRICSAQVEKVEMDREKEFAFVHSYGLVHWWMPIGESVAHCPMDITWFPLDTQNCPLIYESWTLNIEQLNMTLFDPDVDLSYYQNSGEWQLVGNDAVFMSHYYNTVIYNNLLLRRSSPSLSLLSFLFYLFISDNIVKRL